MVDYLHETYPYALVKDLLWCRQYHRSIIQDIEARLRQLSKKHQLSVTLD
jgi:hypothetical protein